MTSNAEGFEVVEVMKATQHHVSAEAGNDVVYFQTFSFAAGAPFAHRDFVSGLRAK